MKTFFHSKSYLTFVALIAVVIAFFVCSDAVRGQAAAPARRVLAPAPAPRPADAANAADAKSDPAAATSQPAKKLDGPKGSFELVEWSILVIDPNRPNANEAAAFKSTMPGFARGRRPVPNPAPGASTDSIKDVMKNPSPVGVIRLIGKYAEGEDPIDVLLQIPAGRLLAQWPSGKPKPNRQLWDNILLKEDAGKVLPVEAGHWFETLRKGSDAGEAAPLSASRWSERFLMYDVELPFPNVLRVKAATGPDNKPIPGALQLANAGTTVMRDVEVYSPTPDKTGWRVATLAELAATKKPAATKPTTGPTTGPTTAPAAADAEEIFGAGEAQKKEKVARAAATAAEAEARAEMIKNAAIAKEAAAAAAKEGVAVKVAVTAATGPSTQPATQPTTKPAEVASDVPKDAWRDLRIAADAKVLPAADALANWRTRLKEAGLTSADIETIIATLRTHALDGEQLTVVYRVDASEMDRLLPLEVVPQPMKITRVCLAIVKNIDPAAGERIAKLIEELANADWDKREAAQTKLAELGAGARPKLTEALKHADIEVVYRVERLLESLNTPQ